MLKYKLDWNGGIYIEGPPKHTIQKCDKCNTLDKDNRNASDFERDHYNMFFTI